MNKDDPVFYVYVYLDPRKPGNYCYGEYTFDFEPFYIGLGKGKRIDDHLRKLFLNDKNNRNKIKTNKILKIQKETKSDPIHFKIKENLVFQEGSDLEIELIRLIGRICEKTGPLTNLTAGGAGFRGLSQEVRERQKMHSVGKHDGSKNGMFGKHHSEESKAKISANRKGQGPKYSDERLERHRIRNTGRGNGFFGKKHSLESKQAISLTRKQKYPSQKQQVISNVLQTLNALAKQRSVELK